jgi:hypothetical protein
MIAVLVALVGLQHAAQAVLGLRGSDPRLLVLEHFDVAIFAFAAAYAVWRNSWWAPWALGVAGAGVAVLIVSLGPLLNMDSVERSGLWIGAASIAVFTALGVWYLARRKNRMSS